MAKVVRIRGWWNKRNTDLMNKGLKHGSKH